VFTKQIHYLFIQAAVCMSLFVACSGDDTDDEFTNPLDVAFTGFSPQTAFIGDEVTLQGNNLGTEPRALFVTFGGVPAEVLRANGSSATVVVPDDIEAASAVIELRANLASLKSAKAFTLKAPVIESIAPTQVRPGQEVIITGKGFRDSEKFEQVKFGNTLVKAELVDPGHTELRLTIPYDAAPGKYPVGVVIAGLAAAASQQIEVIKPPVFTGFSPATAFIGDEITLTGQNLGTDPDWLDVTFGSIRATVVSVDGTTAKVIVPDDIEDTSVKIRISIPHEELLVSAADFTLKAPVIESLSITRGYSGTQMTIVGKGFRNSYKFDQVTFGTKAIEASHISEPGNTALRFSVPDRLAAGKYTLSVDVLGMTATAPEQFEVVVQTVTSITPTSASQYATMKITGKGFIDPNFTGGAIAAVGVTFADGSNLRSAIVTAVTDTEITAIVPQLWAGRTYKVLISVRSSYVEAPQTFNYEDIE
jgi:hypothetical protein